MNWLLEFFTIWLSISVFVIATGWYASTVIAPRYPEWWRRVVVDVDPEYQITQKSAKRRY